MKIKYFLLLFVTFNFVSANDVNIWKPIGPRVVNIQYIIVNDRFVLSNSGLNELCRTKTDFNTNWENLFLTPNIINKAVDTNLIYVKIGKSLLKSSDYGNNWDTIKIDSTEQYFSKIHSNKNVTAIGNDSWISRIKNDESKEHFEIESKLWIMKSNGKIVAINKDTLTIIFPDNSKQKYNLDKRCAVSTISKQIDIDKDDLIIYTSDSGLCQISKNDSVQCFFSLQNSIPNAIHKSNNEDIWIGFKSGIGKCQNGKITYINELTPYFINCINSDSNGNLYIGTETALLLYDGKEVRKIDDNLSTNIGAYAIEKTFDDSTIFICGINNWVYASKNKGQSWKLITNLDSFDPIGYPFTINPMSNTLYVYRNHKLISIDYNGNIDSNKITRKAVYSCYNVAFDNDGTTYMKTSDNKDIPQILWSIDTGFSWFNHELPKEDRYSHNVLWSGRQRNRKIGIYGSKYCIGYVVDGGQWNDLSNSFKEENNGFTGATCWMDTIYLLAASGKLYSSYDLKEWSSVNSNVSKGRLFVTNNGYFYVTGYIGSGGISISNDKGKSWLGDNQGIHASFGPGTTPIYDLIELKDGTIITAAGYDVYSKKIKELSVLKPSSNSVYKPGDMICVKWDAHPAIDSVVAKISYDAGNNWVILNNFKADIDSITWRLGGDCSESVIIRISSSKDENVFDQISISVRNPMNVQMKGTKMFPRYDKQIKMYNMQGKLISKSNSSLIEQKVKLPNGVFVIQEKSNKLTRKIIISK
jgi:hypothetical protein